MAEAHACPDGTTLRRLAKGRVGAAEAEAFARHLEQCAACADRLDGLGAFDDLARVADSPAEYRPDPETLNARIRVWENLPEQARRSAAATPRGTGLATAGGIDLPGPPPAPSLPDNPRYQPVRLLAEGGLGEVFVARDAELHREVALKRVRPEYAADDECRRRFLREAEITGRLEHPGVVPVYGLVEDESGQPCYAMRLIEGESLQEAIKRYHAPGGPPAGERRLALRQLLGHFIAVCNTIAYAHSRGVVHRDLKPANVMLGRYGETVVVDWGLARSASRGPAEWTPGEKTLRLAYDAGATLPGDMLGTPAYMSPEQAAGEDVGPATDVYSLGATLYFLLTGQSPFAGEDPSFVLSSVRAGAFPAPQAVKRDLSPALAAVCVKAMARVPEERYAGARALAEDLERWLADEAVAAYREPGWRRLGRWCRRRRTPVAVAAALLLALLGTSAAGAILWQVGARRELELEHRRAQAELLGRQQAQARLDNLRVAAEGGEKLAAAELRAGNFDGALNLLQAARAAVEDEQDAALVALRDRLGGRAERVGRVVKFYYHSNEAERAIAERFRNPDDPVALNHSTEALQHLGVFDHPVDWWDHLPGADLGPAQQEQLRRDAYRELMLLALLQAKSNGGLSKWGHKTAAESYRKALRTLDLVQRHRPAYSAQVLANALYYLLGEYGKIRPLTLREPTSSADAHFAGTMHVWFAMQRDDAIVQIARKAQAFIDLGVDFKTPEVTAERHLRTALRLEPHHYWTNYWFGVAMMGLGKHETAETALSFCVAQRPQYRVSFAFRAMAVLGQAGHAKDAARKKQLVEHALAGLEESFRHNPGDAWPYAVRGRVYRSGGHLLDQPGYFARALADHTRAVEIDGADATHYEERGQSFYALKRYASAAADFDAALKLDGHEPLLRYFRGMAYADSGDDERALQDLDEAVRRLPNAAVVWDRRGLVLLRRKEYARARADFDKALTLATSAGFLVNRAACHLGLGDANKALADADRALSLEPRRADAHHRRGLARLAGKDLDRALTDLTEAVALAPRAGAYHAAKGDCHRARGEAELAAAVYLRAVELGAADDAAAGLDALAAAHPDRADVLFARGRARLELGDFTTAAAELTRGHDLAATADRGKFLRWRGRARLELGGHEGADADLAAGAVALPNDRPARIDHAIARAALGRLDEAAAGLEALIDGTKPPGAADVVLARVQQARGDRAGFRRLCAALLDRHGKASSPDAAALVVRACLVGPEPGAEASALVPLAELAADRFPRDAAALTSLGAVYLRAGALPRAAERLTAAVERGDRAELPRALYYRALARHRLGQREEAARDLADADKALAAAGPLRWDRRVEMDLLRDEARAAISPAVAAGR